MLYRRTKSAHLQDLETTYLSVREKEERIYSDDQVLILPKISRSHAQYKEWLIRQNSLGRICSFILKHPRVKRILDLGCGNGWMCNALNNRGYAVVGIDVNGLELEQAARLFPNCSFYERDIFEDNADLGTFDVIIISAALQYFKEPVQLIELLKRNLLDKDGFILIADTKFYSPEEVESAQLRTQHYYQSLQENEMTSYYFHHSTTLLKQINSHMVKNPRIFESLYYLFRGIKNPFNLYVIHQNEQTIAVAR
jgi:SAM-dependent methyltransferase